MRIASPENVTQQTAVASSRCSRCLMLPALKFPKDLFPHRKSCLLLWTLWSCGRRASVVQAQRQIHRVIAGYLCAGRCAGVSECCVQSHFGAPAPARATFSKSPISPLLRLRALPVPRGRASRQEFPGAQRDLAPPGRVTASSPAGLLTRRSLPRPLLYPVEPRDRHQPSIYSSCVVASFQRTPRPAPRDRVVAQKRWLVCWARPLPLGGKCRDDDRPAAPARDRRVLSAPDEREGVP
jgi:hypothetical protein